MRPRSPSLGSNGDAGQHSSSKGLPAAALVNSLTLAEFETTANQFLNQLFPPKKPKVQANSDQNSTDQNPQAVEISKKSSDKSVELSANGMTVKLDYSDKTKPILTMQGSNDNLKNLLLYFKQLAESRDGQAQITFEITQPTPLDQAKLDQLLNEINYTDHLKQRVQIRLPQPAADNDHTAQSSVELTQTTRPLQNATPSDTGLTQRALPDNTGSLTPPTLPGNTILTQTTQPAQPAAQNSGSTVATTQSSSATTVTQKSIPRQSNRRVPNWLRCIGHKTDANTADGQAPKPSSAVGGAPSRVAKKPN